MKKLFTLMAMLLFVLQGAMAGVATYNFNVKNGESTPAGFFSHDADGKWSWNNKFTGGEYDGISFTQGLKMEGSTKVLFTTDKVSTVTIVQSTWSANTIKFDDVELAVADATEGTGCRIYTVANVAAGDHTIGRGSGESGLFYVKVEWVDVQTVTFINDANWTSVWVWAWNDTENFTGGADAWPGVELTANDEGNYVWTTEGNPTKILFTENGSETNRTGDQPFEDGATYNSKGKVIVLKNFTATLTTDMEGDVYAYAWSGDGQDVTEFLGGWPGTKLEAADGGVYTVNIEAEKAPEKIIFNNNAGVQTEDLAFVDGKAYEFMSTVYSATFTTDATWETVYAYAWTTTGDVTTIFTETWPGTPLTADENGVYTFTYKTFGDAPANIQFNGGSDDKKTPDMAFTNGRAYKWNTTVTPLYALTASEDAIPAGTTVEVKDADDEVVATLTYGVEGETRKENDVEVPASFYAPAAYPNDDYAGFTAYTAGNGNNGTATSGTVYTIVPKYDGKITVAVWINANKPLYITEDGTALEGYNGLKLSYKANTAFEFDVKAGSEYKVYCTGSKLGFFGFDYTGYTKPIVPAEITEVKFACATEWDNDDHQEWQNGWDITLANTEAEPNVYTGQLDLTGDSRDVLFKLKVNGGGDESDNWAGWIGYKNLTIEAGDLDVTGSKDEENANMRMTRTALAYDKYDLTATWTPSVKYSDGWTLKIEGVGIPTGIQNVNNNAANNGVVYNLTGQRVVNAQKGLFIINGNKVVIK